MKNSQKTVLLFVVTVLLFAQCNRSEKNPQLESQPKNTEANQEILAGGWKTIQVSPTVKDLAAYVLAEKQVSSPLKEITDAASQVVSGRNYRFRMHLQNGETWEAQVYVNLENQRSITSFEQINK